ncbi:Os03g0598002 [Oryza sativa Japonica Group]|uniref:Os03g0598002 protein n=1 Tax=Oryza sativa subsp. japonica TaxID=39947 RepID=A0A0P0W0M2_ORYSJ|nr:hypothetical protein EE612_018760 [Oryza sativa]BAS85175.1 Os03g0598002 [Oryza sativa Japonica Group]
MRRWGEGPRSGLTCSSTSSRRCRRRELAASTSPRRRWRCPTLLTDDGAAPFLPPPHPPAASSGPCSGGVDFVAILLRFVTAILLICSAILGKTFHGRRTGEPFPSLSVRRPSALTPPLHPAAAAIFVSWEPAPQREGEGTGWRRHAAHSARVSRFQRCPRLSFASLCLVPSFSVWSRVQAPHRRKS